MARQKIRRYGVFVLLWATAAALPAAQAPSGTQKSFIWKVQADQGVLYVAGSVHALTADAYPLSAAFERAFAAADTLVEEIDMSEANVVALTPTLLSKGMYQNGRRFDMAVSRETAALVEQRLAATGLPAAMFQTMKPWMVMLTLTSIEAQKAGLDPELGLDKHFYDRAMAAGKRVVGLETAESQIDRLDAMPETLQEQLLLSTVEELDQAAESLGEIVRAWRTGDAAAIEDLLLSSFEEYPAVYQSLIVERNRNWMPRIEACLAQGSRCLVVVGAAHLVGPDGLLTSLQARGYRVEQQ
jgi:uncharacterized protein YbaP (TraB family)